jgi:Rho-binding antiterminator
MTKPFQPVDCGVYDQLEVLAMRRIVCQLEYKGDGGNSIRIESTIVDVFAKSGEEFITLKDGKDIRLDRLISLNGEPVSGTCGISDRE